MNYVEVKVMNLFNNLRRMFKMAKVTYDYAVSATAPIKVARVKNPKGYWDLIVNKSKNGKAIRISNRTGDDAVNIGMSEVDSLITALKDIKTRGAKTSVDELPFNQ